MLYPRKIRILKLTDASARVLIPVLAILMLSPSPGKAEVPEGVAASVTNSVLHLLCGLESVP